MHGSRYKSQAKTGCRFETRETRARNLIQLFSAISSLAYRSRTTLSISPSLSLSLSYSQVPSLLSTLEHSQSPNWPARLTAPIVCPPAPCSRLGMHQAATTMTTMTTMTTRRRIRRAAARTLCISTTIARIELRWLAESFHVIISELNEPTGPRSQLAR